MARLSSSVRPPLERRKIMRSLRIGLLCALINVAISVPFSLIPAGLLEGLHGWVIVWTAAFMGFGESMMFVKLV